MINIEEQLVSRSVINKRSFGFGNPAKYITVHQTGNPSKGADAQAHANIQRNGNPRVASWHYQVDDKVAIQSFPDNVMCWAATDGRGVGNTQSIHVEICINSDGDYDKAIQNAAELVRYLKDKHGAEIKQHNHWYPKNCPQQLREDYKGIAWKDFLNKVESSSEKLKVDGYLGPNTISALQRHFGTVVDGFISEPSLLVEAIQKWLGTPIDGVISEPSLMVKALQKRLGTPVDGVISTPSMMVAELQRRLNKGSL